MTKGAPGVSLPEPYRRPATLLALARAGIGPAEAEVMDPRDVAGILDLLHAEGEAVAMAHREAEARRR